MEETKLTRFISGYSDKEERKEVLQWISQNDENKQAYARLKNLSVAIDLQAESLREENLVKRQKMRKMLKHFISTAAVLIIIASAFYLGKKKENTKWEKLSISQYTEIVAPYGATVATTLPDGSYVKLNGGSSLKFSKLYGHHERNVILSGEGYFEVKKSTKQFKVSTDILQIVVLGTVFNVSAYPEDDQASATLYQGSVSVMEKTTRKNTLLKPIMQYSYDKKTHLSSLSTLSIARRWTDNYIIADRDDIKKFAKKIERKYNVKIVISEELLGKCLYTGAFKGETLKEILDNMSFASPVKYRIDNKNIVHLSPKEKKLNI